MAQHNTEVLHQRKSLGKCPLKMAMTGVAFAGIVGYFVLYSNKNLKPLLLMLPRSLLVLLILTILIHAAKI
ncbi:hypothetical protein Dsin_033220 [Dipteronia sinensis]|uniref:Uncharacterized protein n=1 Tax=Dipteronia sinensis TaxID=43782 RepID=A0AAD9ZFT1_9ROSI|nr:hypothetical protein Dsin_033220 [Dipteronia sinensis]